MGTRNRAFAVFHRVVLDQRSAIDHQAIAGGNLFSHAGNVLADCHLFKKRIRYDSSPFDISMETWDLSAKWPEKFGGCTLKVRELKPNLMSLVVENKDGNSSQLGKDKTVRASWLETIPSPPERWTAKSNEKSNEIRDHRSLIVECEYPMWKVANILWKLKRGGSLVEDATVYIDCALKVTEVPHYQWSQQFVYYFLHYGKFIRLLRFDRAGLVVSGNVDIRKISTLLAIGVRKQPSNPTSRKYHNI